MGGPGDLMDDYTGAFEPEFGLERLGRAALGRLARETMLLAAFHDRGLMPLLGQRFGPKAMTDVACDEWIGSSPIYNPRVRRLLGVSGDGVPAVLKAFQLDVGFPHRFMDVGYEVANERLGWFWLKRCGQLHDVSAMSGGSERAIVQLCHHMEDPTFPATVTAVNRRAKVLPEHRPPLQIGHTGPDCRWRVEIGDDEDQFEELAITDVIRASRAARYEPAPLAGAPGEGLADYSGALDPDFALEKLAQPVLVQTCGELALDVHLLMRAAFVSVRERFGADAADEIAREQWATVAPVYVPRVRAALGIAGDDVASVLKTLQVEPSLPAGYVRSGARLLDETRGCFWLEDCEALAPGEPEAWTALLGDEKWPGLGWVAAAVNPRARLHPVDPARVGAPAQLAWEVTIDPDTEPLAAPPLTGLVQGSQLGSFPRQADS